MRAQVDGPGGVTEALVPWVAAARVGAAAALLAVPSLAARVTGLAPWPPARTLVRALGVRELALGAGTLRAWWRDEQLARWIAAQCAVDGGDTVLFLLAVRGGLLPPGRGLSQAAFACCGAAFECLTWRRLTSP